MAIRQSRPSRQGTSLDEDRRPRLHISIVATLVGALAIVNVASAVLAMLD
ncbi:MAG TPA: hypothetical protein VEZ24_03690 [Microvirga sp.]|nr:hypothetical protein [Microvirga sp.]